MASFSRLRVGLIGTGFGSRVMIPAFRRAELEVTAVCSSNARRAKRVADENGVSFWTPHASVLAQRRDVDLVYVASPPTMHCEHVLTALAAGKHVLCEKPLARDSTEASRMVAAARQAGVVNAVDHEFRYLPTRQRVFELLRAGELGEIRLVHVVEHSTVLADASTPRAEWWLRRDRGGGQLGALGSHWIDTLIWWCGGVDRVAAQLATFIRERPVSTGGPPLKVTSDDTAVLVLWFRSGSIATIQISCVMERPLREVHVLGSRGSATIDSQGRLLVAYDGGDSQEVVPASGVWNTAGGVSKEQLDALSHLIGSVRDHIQGGSAVLASNALALRHPTFDDGLHVQQVLDAAYRSEGEIIMPSPPAPSVS